MKGVETVIWRHATFSRVCSPHSSPTIPTLQSYITTEGRLQYEEFANAERAKRGFPVRDLSHYLEPESDEIDTAKAGTKRATSPASPVEGTAKATDKPKARSNTRRKAKTQGTSKEEKKTGMAQNKRKRTRSSAEEGASSAKRSRRSEKSSDDDGQGDMDKSDDSNRYGTIRPVAIFTRQDLTRLPAVTGRQLPQPRRRKGQLRSTRATKGNIATKSRQLRSGSKTSKLRRRRLSTMPKLKQSDSRGASLPQSCRPHLTSTFLRRILGELRL